MRMAAVSAALAAALACSALPARAAPIPALREGASAADIEAWLGRYIDPRSGVLSRQNEDGVALYDPFTMEKSAEGHLIGWFRSEFYRPRKDGDTTFRSNRNRLEINCQTFAFRVLANELFAENNLGGRKIDRAVPGGWVEGFPEDTTVGQDARVACSYAPLIGSPDQSRALPLPPAEGETVAAWRTRAVDPAGDIFLTEEDGVSTYYSPKELERRPDGHVEAWYRDELARPVALMTTGVRSTRTQVEIDCARRRARSLNYVLYPGANLLGPGFDDFEPSDAWTAFEPGANRTRIMRALCRLAAVTDTPLAEAMRQPEVPPPVGTSDEDVRAWIAAHIDTGKYAFSYSDQTSAFFYGTEDLSLLTSGNPVAYLRKEDFAAASGPEPVRSFISSVEYDCARRRTRILRSVYFAEANLEGMAYDGGEDGWSKPFDERSYGYINLRQICDLRSLLGGDVDLAAALPPPPAAIDDAEVVAWLQGYIAPAGYAFAGYNERGVALYSTEEIERTAQDHIRVWTRSEMFEPTDGVRSMRMLEEYDCEQGRSRLLATELYPGANLLGEKEENLAEDAAWTFNSPGSLRSLVANQLCALANSGEDDGTISEPLLPADEGPTPL
jgi:hypothetical protein